MLSELKKHAENSPHFFPDDTLTDQPERVLAAEMIREKMLRLLDKEIPHGVAVSIELMRERDTSDIMDVEATIYCERESHKGIIIGKGGSMLKKISTFAREDMEKFFGIKVNLRCGSRLKRTGVTERDLYTILVLIDRHNTAAHGEFKYISFRGRCFLSITRFIGICLRKAVKSRTILYTAESKTASVVQPKRAKAMGVNVKGLILKEQNIGENDKLVTVLTDSLGVLRAFVRGAKKLSSKKQSATGLLCYSKLSLYKTKDSYIIEEAESIESFFGCETI